MYSIGMQYLPVSTVSLISVSQLAFNAFFSYFLNSQKFTKFIINSLVLLAISSALLVFQNDGSAGCGLLLSATALLSQGSKEANIHGGHGLDNLSITGCNLCYPGQTDWKGLKKEMEEFGLGKVSYVMTLVWAAIAWQIFLLVL